MKKIAIVTPCFFGATFPLAKRWIGEGYQVDYFFLAGDTVDINEGVDFKPFNSKSYIGDVDYESCPELFDYFDSDSFHLRYFSRPRPFGRVPVVRSIMKVVLYLYDRRFANFINEQHYDYVNLIGQCSTSYYKTLLHYIKSPIVVSLHEVVPNLVNKRNAVMPVWFRTVFELKCPIIVHSQNSYEDLKQYKGIDFNQVHLIHFGLFETFKLIKQDEEILKKLPARFVLFFGVIRPYKGLDLLYDAVNNHRDYFVNTKVVVAGSGSDEYIKKIKDDEAFVCINRRISNPELAALITNSLFVVCPYRGVSQSGIPQTTFVFNKPIVATNLNAFREMMTDGDNCLLFEPENSEDLSLKMKQMMESASSFEQHISQFEKKNVSFNWNTISEQYFKVFESL